MANEDRLARIERSIERLVSALGPPATTAEAEQTKRVQDAATKFLRSLDLDAAQQYLAELNTIIPPQKPGEPVALTTVTVTVTVTITITVRQQ